MISKGIIARLHSVAGRTLFWVAIASALLFDAFPVYQGVIIAAVTITGVLAVASYLFGVLHKTHEDQLDTTSDQAIVPGDAASEFPWDALVTVMDSVRQYAAQLDVEPSHVMYQQSWMLYYSRSHIDVQTWKKSSDRSWFRLLIRTADYETTQLVRSIGQSTPYSDTSVVLDASLPPMWDPNESPRSSMERAYFKKRTDLEITSVPSRDWGEPKHRVEEIVAAPRAVAGS